MKAQELRIGNLINQDNEPVNVYQLDSGGITFCQINNFRINKETGAEQNSHRIMFSGIPLTEEWLLKFGWIWNEECKSYEKYPNGDARMHLQYRDVSNSYTMFNYVLKAVIAERIFYVHQLQNLYFALTGKELLTP